MIIHINFKVDDKEEPELVQWLKTLKKKERTLSYNIRQALKSYLSRVGALPVISVNPGNLPTLDLVIETGDILIESIDGVLFLVHIPNQHKMQPDS